MSNIEAALAAKLARIARGRPRPEARVMWGPEVPTLLIEVAPARGGDHG